VGRNVIETAKYIVFVLLASAATYTTMGLLAYDAKPSDVLNFGNIYAAYVPILVTPFALIIPMVFFRNAGPLAATLATMCAFTLQVAWQVFQAYSVSDPIAKAYVFFALWQPILGVIIALIGLGFFLRRSGSKA
jgi:hypothetical protein